MNMYRYKRYIAISVLFILIFIIGFIQWSSKSTTNIVEANLNENHELDADLTDNLDLNSNDKVIPKEKTIEEIHIDIKGAIKNPGVYRMNENDRVFNAIEAADGFVKNADKDMVNLALKLQDEMLVYIPFIGDDISEIQMQMPITSSGQSSMEGVHINSASEAELQSLSGIGPSKAQAIVKYIEENGPIQDANDLLEISGIGEKTLEKFVDELIIP